MNISDIKSRMRAAPARIQTQTERELALYCAILLLEGERAQAELARLRPENESLRRELADQRRIARVVAFPARRKKGADK